MFFFLISHHKVFSLPFITLVEFWFGLILSFLEIRIWVYIKKQFTYGYEFEYAYQLIE